jgi:hypothetical protein
MDLAIEEANESGARFSGISVVGQKDWDGGPCSCGRPKVLKLGHCHKCGVTHRMLGKIESEAKAVASFLRRLNTQIKELRN